jgi:hypothetical protein
MWRLIVLAWFIIGVLVAGSHNYFHFNTLSQIFSLILAVILWPAVLFGHHPFAIVHT